MNSTVPPLAQLAFSLNTSQEWKDSEDNVYKITVSSFRLHDHDHAPIYYLDYPLHESVKRENADGIVVSVACSSDDLPSPYSAVVEKSWTVCRKHIDLQFILQNRNEVVMDCIISKANHPRKVLGFKGSIPPEEIQKAIDNFKSK